MYFKLKKEIGEKYGVTQWPKLPDGVFAFQTGEFITVEIPEPLEYLVDHTSIHPPTDFVTGFMPVFSDRLLSAFISAGVSNLQTFNAILRNPVTGETWSNYKVINVLGMISCVDHENSIFEREVGSGYEFEKLVIDTDRANGELFFRIGESSGMLIVHNQVLDFMYDKEDDPLYNGVDFIPIISSKNIK